MTASSLVDTLLAIGVERRVAAGEVVCAEGDAGDEAYVVVDGELVATTQGPLGPIVVARHGSGALVGEVTVVVGGMRTATLIATVETTLCVVDEPTLLEAFEAHPIEAEGILRTARQRTDRTRVAALLAEELQAPDGEAVAAIADRVTWRTLQSGETLFRRGDPADAAYLVVSGRLAIGDDPDNPFIEIGRGAIVGEFGLLEDRDRSQTVSAMRDTTLARLSAADFRSLTVNYTPLAMGLVRRILDRSRPDSRPRTPARSCAFVVTARNEADPSAIVEIVATAIAPYGSTRLLSAARVDELLHRPGIAQTPAGAFGEVRLAELLHKAETDDDHLVFDAGDPRSEWAARSLRQADLVVIVCSPEPAADEERAIRDVLARLPRQVPAWLAAVHPADAERPRQGAELKARFGVGEVHHVRRSSDPRSDPFGDVARLGRLAAGRGHALVLSGGGARGNAHVGVVRALQDHGVPIDRVIGASMGSIVAGAVAQGLSWPVIRSGLATGSSKLLDYTVPVVSLIRGARIVEVLENHFDSWTIDDVWIPFGCVSTNLTNAQTVEHRSGRIVDAIRSSIAIPGLLPPVPHGDDLLVDGGVLHNLPIGMVSTDRSVGTIIASDVAPPVGPAAKHDFGLSVSGWAVMKARLRRRRGVGAGDLYPGLNAVLMRAMLIGSARDRDEHLRSGRIDLYLDLDLRNIGLLDFPQALLAADRGYASAHDRVAAWAQGHPTALGCGAACSS